MSDESSTSRPGTEAASGPLAEIVSLLQAQKQELCREWAELAVDAGMLPEYTIDEVVASVGEVYDCYLEGMQIGTPAAMRSYAKALTDWLYDDAATPLAIVSGQRRLHDILIRAIVRHGGGNLEHTLGLLFPFQETANRMAVESIGELIVERERTIRDQQKAIRELSTPVLQVRERLLISPLIGIIDPPRARQVMEQLLQRIRENRARVVVVDITGVPVMDSQVANSLVQTVEACRLLGASVVVSGISPEIAQTLVRIGVNLDKMTTTGDLQGAIEEAERRLGYGLVRDSTPAADWEDDDLLVAP